MPRTFILKKLFAAGNELFTRDNADSLGSVLTDAQLDRAVALGLIEETGLSNLPPVSMEPVVKLVNVGDTVSLDIKELTEQNLLTRGSVIYTSLTPGIVSVSSTGLVTALSVGVGQVQVRGSGYTKVIQLFVGDPVATVPPLVPTYAQNFFAPDGSVNVPELYRPAVIVGEQLKVADSNVVLENSPMAQAHSQAFFSGPGTGFTFASRFYGGAPEQWNGNGISEQNGQWASIIDPGNGDNGGVFKVAPPEVGLDVCEFIRTDPAVQAHAQVATGATANMNTTETAAGDRTDRAYRWAVALRAFDATDVGKTLRIRTRGLDVPAGFYRTGAILLETSVVLTLAWQWVQMLAPTAYPILAGGQPDLQTFIESDAAVDGVGGCAQHFYAAFGSDAPEAIQGVGNEGRPWMFDTRYGVQSENACQICWPDNWNPKKGAGGAIADTAELFPLASSYRTPYYWKTVVLNPGDTIEPAAAGYFQFGILSNIGVSQPDDPGQPADPARFAWGQVMIAPTGGVMPADGALVFGTTNDPADAPWRGATTEQPLVRDPVQLRGADGRAVYRARLALNVPDAALADTLTNYVANAAPTKHVRPYIKNASGAALTVKFCLPILVSEATLDTRNTGWHHCTLPRKTEADAVTYHGGNFLEIATFATKYVTRREGWMALRCVFPMAWDDMARMGIGKADLWQSGPYGSADLSFDAAVYPSLNDPGHAGQARLTAKASTGGGDEWSVVVYFPNRVAGSSAPVLFPAFGTIDLVLGWKDYAPVALGLRSPNTGGWLWAAANNAVAPLGGGTIMTAAPNPPVNDWDFTDHIGILADRDVTGMYSSYLRHLHFGNTIGNSANFQRAAEDLVTTYFGDPIQF